MTGPQLGGTSSASVQSPAAENPALTLKIVSSKKKSEYVIQNLRLTTRFSSLNNLKEQVMSKCDGKVSFDEGFGYIEPGRGVKGKQRWLLSDEDVADMYTLHDGKKEIYCGVTRPKRVVNDPTLLNLMNVALHRSGQDTISKLTR